MTKVTTHQAKTHLSRLLERVLEGEEVVIYRGPVAVAKLVPAKRGNKPRRRPPVGTVTSERVNTTEDAFAPLTDEELGSWGI